METKYAIKRMNRAGFLFTLLFAAALTLSAAGLIPAGRQAAAQSPHPDAARFTVSGGAAEITEDENGKPVIALNPAVSGGTVTVDYDRYISVGDWMDGSKKIVDFTPRAENSLWANCPFGAVTVTMEDGADPSQQLVFAVKNAHTKDGEFCFTAGFSDVGVYAGAFQQFFDFSGRPYIGKLYHSGGVYSATEGHLGNASFYHPGDNINGFFFVYDNTARVMNTWDRELQPGDQWNLIELNNPEVIGNYANGDASVTGIPELFTSGWFKVRFKFYGVAAGGAAFTVNSIGSDDLTGGRTPGEVFETTAADINGGTQKILVRADIPVSEFASRPLLDMQLQTNLSASYFAVVIQDSQNAGKQLILKFSRLNNYGQSGDRYTDGMGASLSEASVRAGKAAIGRNSNAGWLVWPSLTNCSSPFGALYGGWAGNSSNFMEGKFRHAVGFSYTVSNAAIGCYHGGVCPTNPPCSGPVLHNCNDDTFSWTNQNLAGAGWNTNSGADWQTASKTADAGNAALYNDSYILNLFGGTVDVYVFAGAAASVKVFRCGAKSFLSAGGGTPPPVAPPALSAPGSVDTAQGFVYTLSNFAALGKVTGGYYNLPELPLADVEAFNAFDVKYNAAAVELADGDYLIFSYTGAASVRADVNVRPLPAAPSSLSAEAGTPLSFEPGIAAMVNLYAAAGFGIKSFAVYTAGGSPALVTSGLSSVITAVGNYTVRYTLADAIGNISTEMSLPLAVLDLTPPVITVFGNYPAAVAGVAAALIQPIILDDRSGVITVFSVTVRDAGGEDVTGAVYDAGAKTLTFTAEGVYTVTYGAQDGSGNRAAPVVRSITVVKAALSAAAPPVITVKGAYASAFTGKTIALLLPEITDGEGGLITAYTVTVLDETGADVTSGVFNAQTKQLKFTQAGFYTVIIGAGDAAGVQATPAIKVIEVFKPVDGGCKRGGKTAALTAFTAALAAILFIKRNRA